MTASGNLPPGYAHVALDVVDSTNAEALRRAGQGEQGPLWITAGRQTRGRGRSGRAWLSPFGNVSATLLFRPGCQPAALPQLSLVAGVAAHDTIAAVLPGALGPELRLKWPNDILIASAKVAGILVESMTIGTGAVAAIGIGINVACVPDLGDRSVTALAVHGTMEDAAFVSRTLAASLDRWIGRWQSGRNFEDIRTAWLDRSGALGEPLTVHVGADTVVGAYAGLASDGALLLDDAAGIRRKFAFGDVALRPRRV